MKGILKFEYLFTDMAGASRVANGGQIKDDGTYTSWKPSPILRLATALPVDKTATGDMNVRLRISADLDGGWVADDVFVDPLRR